MIVIECPGCGKRYKVSEEKLGLRGKCKQCGAEIVAEPAPTEIEARAALPKQMLANKAVAGRSCPVCAELVGLGQPVRNCELCGSTHHEACWGTHGGCTTPLCGNSPLPAIAEPEPPPPPPAAAPQPGAPPRPDKPRKPCPSCGEMIVAKASRCRFCGGNLDRPGPAPAAKVRKSSDVNGLAVASMVCGICSIVICFIGFIIGPIAIGLAIGARKDMARAGSTPKNEQMATIGFIGGAIGTVVALILMLIGLTSG